MEWLWHNFIADMRGPWFLLFYACASAAAVVVCRVVVRQLDWTGRMPPPPVPAAPDPYEIACLRGGENEVTRAAVFALIKDEWLSFSRRGRKIVIERTTPAPARGALGQVERRAFDWFERPRESGEVFKSGGLAEKMRGLCAGYEQALRRDHLLTPPDVRGRVWMVRLAGLAFVVGLGGYKLLVALSKGRTNVGFLVVLCVVACLVMLAATRLPRMSRRGRAHLERLRLAFERLRGGGTKAGVYEALSETVPHAPTPGVARAVDPSLVALGVFGVGALGAADYENYKAAFKHASADGGSSCGSGCGSSSGGSSDGGGGGCGSSCGGGCGGCGGD